MSTAADHGSARVPRPAVLVTGAAGRLGRALLADLADEFDLRLLDRRPADDLPGLIVGDVTDPVVLDRAMAGAGAVVHLAGDARPAATWPELRGPNIDGAHEVFTAAVRNGVERVVFASSNRVVEAASPLRGPAPAGGEMTADHPVAPDTLYGVGKAFGEALGAQMAHAHGLRVVSLRLGSVDTAARPTIADKPRAWALWLSRRDLVGLVRAALSAQWSGAPVVYACSANTRRWWDLDHTERVLGYRPVDDSEHHLHAGRAGLVPPAPAYPLPWGDRLARLVPPVGRVALVALGQSGFWLRTAGPDGVRLAVDPFLTEYPDRLQAPLCRPDDLPVDLVLVTHTHRDHLDAPALATLAAARPGVRFAGPPTVTARLAELEIDEGRITTIGPGGTITVGDVTVTAIAARHRPTTPDAQGYLVATPAASFYHTGDTELDACLDDAATRRPDVLAVPINGRKGNMTAEQAAELAHRLGVPVVVPMHYGCLQPVDDLLDRFRAALTAGSSPVRVAEMDPGAIAWLPFPPAPPPGDAAP